MRGRLDGGGIQLVGGITQSWDLILGFGFVLGLSLCLSLSYYSCIFEIPRRFWAQGGGRGWGEERGEHGKADFLSAVILFGKGSWYGLLGGVRGREEKIGL